MDRDTLLELAREVGLWEMLEGYSSEYGSLDAEEDCLPDLQRFAALVAAHEREACAKVVEAEQARVLSKQEGKSWEPVNINIRMTAVLLPEIATAIRSRP